MIVLLALVVASWLVMARWQRHPTLAFTAAWLLPVVVLVVSPEARQVFVDTFHL